jgi:acetyl-CoA carboxylase biotin carboxyl carrier protein
MSASSSSNQDIFDVRKLRRLVELMKEHDLSEVDLQQGETRIQLRRSALTAAANASLGAVPAAYAAAPAMVAQAPAAKEADTASAIAVIQSPMVGTFYAAPDPESPPYVKVGDHVGRETTVCIVEAMKVFNQIPAEVSGRVVAVLVENGESVEFGQPLFKVDTRE